MKFLRFGFSLLIVILLLSACGTPAKPVSAPLRIAVNLWPGIYPAAIAQEQGFFTKHNVKVKLIYYNAYPDTYADLIAEKIDGLNASLGDMLSINTQKNIKFIFPVDASDGADELLATANIKNVSNLKGKRIGVNLGTYGELFLRTLLKQNGLTLTDVKLINISAENAAQAFPDQVDAIHTYEPYASDVVKKGGHILITSTATPNLILGMMTFPARLVKERPDDIQAFTDAWFEAVDWMNANPDKVPAVVAKAFGLKPEDVWFGGDKVISLAEAKAMMKPGNDSSSVYFTTQSYIDFLATSGLLSTKPKSENLIDPSFLK